ncbi:MAG: hypothetical protein AB8I08_20155 [Sandaracinaceae bacterium]
MEIVSEGPTHCFAGVGNVLVSVYWGAPGVGPLHERIPWIERTIATHGTFGLLVVVLDGVRQPPGQGVSRRVPRAVDALPRGVRVHVRGHPGRGHRSCAASSAA